MSAAGLVWQPGHAPSDLAREIEDYGRRLEQAVLALAQYLAEVAEAYAKAHATWSDRTGEDRRALRGQAVALADQVVAIYLSHGLDSGRWIELAHGGKFAIVLPTLESLYGEVMQLLRRLVGDR